MSDAVKPMRRVTRYQVSCLPEEHQDTDVFAVTVVYRGNGRWAVQRGESRFYGADGVWSFGFGWDHEPVTDEERDAFEAGNTVWLASHRFDEETALRLADEAAPNVVVNGFTVADALAEVGQSDGEGV